jgi:hypothetical protein
MIAFAILALVPLAAGVESHPIEKVINLLKKLKDQAIEEGKTEEVSFAKFKYWCSTSTSEVSKAIEEEKANIDELESAIKGFKEDKKALEDQIDELEDQIKDLEAEAKAAKEADEKRNKAYIADKKDLKATIKAMDDAIAAMQGASKTDSALLQSNAQESVRSALAVLALKTSDEQQKVLLNFVDADAGKPDQLAKGDLNTHVKKYSFKSDNVIDLLKELKLKFQDDLTAADSAETNGANAYAVEKNARDAATDASKKSNTQKKKNLAETKSSLGEAEGDLKNEKADLEADEKTLKETKETCNAKTEEWNERSETRAGEVEALAEAAKILAKVSGVRTEAPSNPVPPASPVDFLQVVDPKAQAVNLLRQTAKTVHSKALERLALEVSTHLTGPFDKVNDMIQKMIFRLMAEQTDEDKHKAWCDLETEKSDKSESDKKDEIKQINANIESEKAKVQALVDEITEADKMVADITAFMEEATEIRTAGKSENKVAIKDAKDAQTAIANAIAVLEEHYKSSGQVKKEPWEFIQKSSDPVKLPKDPKLWDSGYTGVADPKKQDTGVIAILETCAADFSKMEAETKAQEVEDQKKYDDQMKAHKIEKSRRQQESDAKVQEKKRKVAKIESETKNLKHTTDELEAVQKYIKDLQPACVEGDSTYKDRKAARGKEIKALKEAQDLLKNAFKKKGSSFLEVKRHA